VFGLPGEFSLSRDDVRRVARRPARPAARALPETVVAQLLDEPALGLLEEMHGARVRMAVEVLADTGRRPNEISSSRGTASTTTGRVDRADRTDVVRDELLRASVV
jgi:hypothetical protein